MDGRHALFFVLITLAIGCGRASEPDYPKIQAVPLAYTPNPRSSNAFDGYVQAALTTEQEAAEFLNKVDFLPTARGKAMAACASSVSLVAASTQKECKFEFRPSAPFSAPPYQRGWRLIGRCLVWNIEQALANQDRATAVRNFVVATRFGFDLTTGGALDASLGLAIVNEARVALLKGIDALQIADLMAAAKGVQSRVEEGPRRAAVASMLENEKSNMLMAIQFVQDSYQANKLDALDDNLLVGARPAVSYLRDLKGKDGERRVAYFKGFAADVPLYIEHFQQLYATPTKDRKKLTKLKLASDGDRPWRRFTRHFFEAARYVLPVVDSTVARTRMFVLYANALAEYKKTGKAPNDLLVPEVSIDPFSGVKFIYKGEGRDIRIHSVGVDGENNAGDTNSIFEAPDLCLEVR